MSLRNVRKMFGTGPALPPLEGNSDEEFEPHFAKEKKGFFSYAGLELSSGSESEQEVPEKEEELVKPEEKPKKKKNNKKKRRQKPTVNTDRSEDNDLDEIDKSVKEVNDLLGAPLPSISEPIKQQDPRKLLLSVQAKHLEYTNELKRLFGSESLDESGRGKKYKPHNVVKYRRAVIVATSEKFTSVGLSMGLNKRENGCSYFIFNHSKEYQLRHQDLYKYMQHNVIPLQESQTNSHIEALLEATSFFFVSEEYTSANKLLEFIISYLHYIAHPSFNLTDQSVRLEYKYLENRPFFVTVLRFLYMLTNKACHRTALELAKLLLNLDPSDPLAIIYVIDVIALRAREHQWLIDVADYWKTERDAGYLFNIQYSYAMAHFHVAKKNKSNDYSRADELLQEAMLLYPTVAVRIFESCNQETSQQLRDHPYFNIAAEAKFPEKIRVAIGFHSKLVNWRWREPPVAAWFFKNAKELMHKLDTDPATKKRGADMLLKRRHLLAGCPDEITRHLLVVQPMAKLVIEADLPLKMPYYYTWDPLPPANGINRYKYKIERDPTFQRETTLLT